MADKQDCLFPVGWREKTVITIGKNNIDKKLCFSIVLNKAGKEKKTNLRTPDAVITKA